MTTCWITKCFPSARLIDTLLATAPGLSSKRQTLDMLPLPSNTFAKNVLSKINQLKPMLQQDNLNIHFLNKEHCVFIPILIDMNMDAGEMCI